MEISTFLLRLVGADPEQKAEQERLKKNLDKMAESDLVLDDILARVERINTAAKKKLVDSDPPPAPARLPKPPAVPKLPKR